MSNENDNDVVSAIGWFFCGAVLGAGAALLFAPDSGKKTRRRIARQAERGSRSLVESSQDAIARGRELFERGREIAEEAAEMFERGRKVAEKAFDEKI
jgi:gas vesicle protein